MKKVKINNKSKFLIFIIISIVSIIIIFSMIFLINLFLNRKSDIYDDEGNKVKTSDISDINKYSSFNSDGSDIEKLSVESYFTELEELLLIDNTDMLYNKMNKEFLEKNSLNENNFKDYVVNNNYVGKFPSVTTIRYAVQRDGSCVYRAKCFSDDRSQYFLNLIETKPYEYTIDFSQDIVPTTDSKIYTVVSDNISYELSEISRKPNSIAYKLKVTNNSDKEVEFKLNNITDMQLILDNNDIVKQSTSVLSSRTYKLKKDSYFIKTLYFPLDMQYHSKVVGMTFNDVKFEDVSRNITVNF